MKTSICAALILVGGLALLSLLPVARRTNPPILSNRTIETNLNIPPKVEAIFNRTCQDCHSYKTRWPWYSGIAPISWFIVHDVERARDAVNLSDWSIQVGRKRTTAIGALAAACEEVKIGRMPPARYRILHPHANLTENDIDVLCEFTLAQTREIAAKSASLRHGRLPVR